MQVLNDSTQTAFDTMSTASARYPAHQFMVAWKRNTGASAFGIVGTSLLNNCLVRGEINVVTPTDTFDFDDESARVLRLEYDRRVDEPLGGLSFAMMNVVLDNTDLRFTPEFNSTIGTALLPNRPLKMAIGFNLPNGKKMLNVFKGLSDMIKENKTDRSVEFGGYDYLSYLRDLQMDTGIYQDYRSDQIIEQLLIEAGFGSSQYELDVGLNTISFAWFTKDQTAGDRIKQICEAEEAHFYQDENGILRFENRRHYSISPYSSIQKAIHSGDIVDWQIINDVGIVNSVTVVANPREVVANDVEVWRDGIVEEIPTEGSLEIWAQMSNPNYSYVTPVATTDYVANSASDGSGTNITTGVSLGLTEFAETVKIVITNNSGRKAFMTRLRLRGKPALVTSEIVQKYEDNVSIERYGKKVIEVNNDFIDDNSFAYYLARTIVNKYKDPLKRVRILIRGMPQLQLKDKVNVFDRDLGTYKVYRVMGIQGVYNLGEFLQYVTLREVSVGEADSWAIVGVSAVESLYEVVGF